MKEQEKTTNQSTSSRKGIIFYLGVIGIAVLILWNIFVYVVLRSGSGDPNIGWFLLFISPVHFAIWLLCPLFIFAVVNSLKESMQVSSPNPPLWLFILNMSLGIYAIIFFCVNILYPGDWRDPYFIIFGQHTILLLGALLITTISANRQYLKKKNNI